MRTSALAYDRTSFLVIGGVGTDKIYKYNAGTEQFDVMTVTLSETKGFAKAIAVSRNDLSCVY